MDIIKNLDAHIGTDAYGDTVFVACRRDCITFEYINELKKYIDLKDI